MQRAIAWTTTTTTPCRRPVNRSFIASQPWRCFATAADPPPRPSSSKSPSSSSSNQYANSPWRRPLGSAQTLTLLSSSSRALLFALEQSLQGAIKAIEKTTPAGEQGKQDQDSFTLVFAIDKTLPKEVLGGATQMLRDVAMPHVGVLCDPLPEAWLPPAALGEAASSSSSSASSSQFPLLHLVSLSLLPSTLVTPFASTIPGSAPIKAGRWATGKAAFDDSHSRVDALAETEGKDWRDLWGRENASNALPTVLEGMKAEDVLATLVVGSDDAPQGLLEGLDARHASGGAPLVGSLASNTFFETGGRDRCMFYRASSKTEAELRDKGAVGLVFASQSQAAASSGGGSGSSKPTLETKTPWQRLEALPQGRDSTAKPTLRRITRAKGNIVSLLAEKDDSSPPEGRNACQAFLRDVAEGRKSSTTASSEAAATASKNNMTPEEQRNLSSRVGKEEQFWAAVYRSPRDAEEKTPRPVLVSRILSGHPGRGTLSLETDLDLSEGGAMEDPIAGLGTKRGELWIQFFKQVGDERGQHHVIDVPGSDLGAWALPRFLFVAAPTTEAAAPTSAAASAPEAAAKQQKARVHALPNVFLLPSSGAPSSTAGGSDAEDGGGGSILKREGGGNSASTMVKGEEGKLSSDVERRTSMWRLPGTSVLLDLRGEAGSGAGDGKKPS